MLKHYSSAPLLPAAFPGLLARAAPPAEAPASPPPRLRDGGVAFGSAAALEPEQQQEEQQQEELLHVSVATLLGVAQMLGHPLEDRDPISVRQDARLVRQLQAATSTPLRDGSQRHIFTVAPLVSARAGPRGQQRAAGHPRHAMQCHAASSPRAAGRPLQPEAGARTTATGSPVPRPPARPQDVLVTRNGPGGSSRFHIIEINGTGIAGLTNMSSGAVNAVLRSLGAAVAERLPQRGATVLVASSSTDATPPTSSTLHEKVRRRGRGRPSAWRRLCRRLAALPCGSAASGPALAAWRQRPPSWATSRPRHRPSCPLPPCRAPAARRRSCMPRRCAARSLPKAAPRAWSTWRRWWAGRAACRRKTTRR
jgi:hypothetical protein